MLLIFLGELLAGGKKTPFYTILVKEEQLTSQVMARNRSQELANKYIDPSKMYYVVVGDAKTQMKDLVKIGLGKPVLIK